MSKQRSGGFTLVELVVIMILVGILAAVAVPRLTSNNYDAAFFKDEVLSGLRYAKRAAVARQQDIQIQYDTVENFLFFRFVEVTPSGIRTTGLMKPTQEGRMGPYQIRPPTGVIFNTPPRQLYFDEHGRCRELATNDVTDWMFSIQADANAPARSFRIVGDTGFVYELP